MKKQTTKAQIYKYHQEIESIKDSIYYILLKGRIQDFYKYNGIILQTIIDTITEIQKEYYESKDGVFAFDVIDGKKIMRLKVEHTQEAYDKSINNYLQTTSTIEI